MESFARRLRELRERRHWSRKELAELCGLSAESVARYERGERVLGLDVAADIARLFGVSLDVLSGL